MTTAAKTVSPRETRVKEVLITINADAATEAARRRAAYKPSPADRARFDAPQTWRVAVAYEGDYIVAEDLDPPHDSPAEFAQRILTALGDGKWDVLVTPSYVFSNYHRSTVVAA